MSTADAPVIRLFDRCVPLVPAGNTIDLAVEQTLDIPNRLKATGPQAVKLVVEGPRLQLSPDDIAGVYPAPGSEESPDEFLPHVALRRRTLPWERVGSHLTTPWVALVVLKESELKFTIDKAGKPGAVVHSAALSSVQAIDPAGYTSMTKNPGGIAAATTADWIYVTNDQLARLLPYRDDLDYLCHVKRVTTGTKDPVDTDHAIVIANRLPDATVPNGAQKPERHAALLVSLERRSDLWAAARGSQKAARAALLVLHHWTFTPSKGGDFEQVVQAIRYRPNGGVLRFGNLAASGRKGVTELSGGFASLMQGNGVLHTPIEHEHAGPVIFRGPLRPFAAPARTAGFAVQAAPEEFEGDAPGGPAQRQRAPDDYSYAAAFELGRLLVLGDAGVLDDLRNLKPTFPLIEPPMKENQLPPALQKPDWVMNETWYEQPWDMGQGPILKGGGVILQEHGEIAGGINVPHIGGWVGDMKANLETAGTPVMMPVVAMDITKVTAETLGAQFAAVLTAAQS